MCILTTMAMAMAAAAASKLPQRSQFRAILITRGLSNNPLNRPAPPPLPLKDQLEFEALVRAAAAPLSSTTPDPNSREPQTKAGIEQEVTKIAKGEELHPHARRAPAPEFEGDTNPRTGEVGGPKHEPIRHGDWSYGGRISDF